jgi:hypothetical protein
MNFKASDFLMKASLFLMKASLKPAIVQCFFCLYNLLEMLQDKTSYKQGGFSFFDGLTRIWVHILLLIKINYLEEQGNFAAKAINLCMDHQLLCR